MNAVTYTDLRQNLKTYMDKVYDSNDALIVARKKKQNIVLISLNEYNSLIETNYLLASEKNAKRLRNSLKQVRSGKGKKKKLAKT